MTRRYVVSGRVQGVGFRDFVRRTARERGVGGWVRNREDGCVESIASGDAGALDGFETDLRRGCRLSRVASVEASEVEETVFREFKIRA